MAGAKSFRVRTSERPWVWGDLRATGTKQRLTGPTHELHNSRVSTRLLAGVLSLGLREESAERHLVRHGRSYQSGHSGVGGATLYARQRLGVKADEVGGLLLREPPLYAKFPEARPQALQRAVDGWCQVLPCPDFGTPVGVR